MEVEEYILEKTKIKIYDDYIVKDVKNQKEYMDNLAINLKRKCRGEEKTWKMIYMRYI